MKTLPLLGILLAPSLLAVPALAWPGYYCSDTSNVVTVPLPAGVPTPGGNTATAIYYDDRAEGNLPGPLPVPVKSPLGLLSGGGTWIYLETNGEAGLQRGGHSSLPTLNLGLIGTGTRDWEICVGPYDNPDELVF